MESLPFQVFTFASSMLASYLTVIYCKRRDHCKLCKISTKIKEEYNEIKTYNNLRRSKRLEEKRNKK